MDGAEAVTNVVGAVTSLASGDPLSLIFNLIPQELKDQADALFKTTSIMTNEGLAKLTKMIAAGDLKIETISSTIKDILEDETIQGLLDGSEVSAEDT